jgi:hypothetical protein
MKHALRFGRTSAAFACSFLWAVVIMSIFGLFPLVIAAKKKGAAVAAVEVAAVGAAAVGAITAVAISAVGAASGAVETMGKFLIENGGTIVFAAAAAGTVVAGLALAKQKVKRLGFQRDYRELSKELQGQSRSEGTKTGYKSSINVFKSWALLHCPDIVGEDGLITAAKIKAASSSARGGAGGNHGMQGQSRRGLKHGRHDDTEDEDVDEEEDDEAERPVTQKHITDSYTP